MKNKATIISFVVSFIVVGSLLAVFLWDRHPDRQPPPPPPAPGQTGDATDDDKGKPADLTVDPTIAEPPVEPQQVIDPARFQISSQALVDAFVGTLGGNSDKILEALARGNVINPADAVRIRESIQKNKLTIDRNNPVTEVGSWDSGSKVRYRLNFEGGSTGIIDLQRGADNLWTIQSVILPDSSEPGRRHVVMRDAMGISEKFLSAVMNADFATARALVDPGLVSNATLAGLCILFEEGEYHLRQRNALKGMFMSGNNAGFLIYLSSSKGGTANMGLTLKKSGDQGWRISEVSLDSLLQAYVKEIADGEETYIPLVKNPQGGDSLVLFFGFNEDTLTARSLKQLEIVAQIARLSSDKKLEISGHTDDIGGEKYNRNLSVRRANAVKAALVKYGVPAGNIDTKGFGKSRPRRTYGSEDPEIKRDEARRVNRRAEMYLDF